MTASSPSFVKPPSRDRILLAVGLGAWALASSGSWVRAWPFTIDDAYISARYAQQWAAGNGLVYNIGEHVEGFSNFVWVCLLALLEVFRVPFEPGVKVLGLASAALAALAMLLLLTRRLAVRNMVVAAVSGLWLGADPAFAVWTVAGLETPLFAALLAWTLYLWLDEGPPSAVNEATLAVVLSLLVWIRPEGPAVPIALLVLTPFFFREPSVRRSRRVASLAAITVFVVGLILRRWYYDAIWPNPYYVKLGGGLPQAVEGLGYWAAAVGRRGGPFLIAWVLLPLLVRNRERTEGVRRAERLILMVLTGYSLFIIKSGREPFPFHRFFVPLIPLVIIVGLPAARHLASRRTAWFVATALVAGSSMVAAPALARGHWAHVRQLTHITQTISLPFGRWVGNTEEFNSTLGVFWAGAMPYAAGPETRAMDLGGLCNRHIARVELPWRERSHGHIKHDYDYFLARRPTYVTDDALYLLEDLIALGGPRAAMYAGYKERFLNRYVRMNAHVFIRVDEDTYERMALYLQAFPDDAPAREAIAEFAAGMDRP